MICVQTFHIHDWVEYCMHKPSQIEIREVNYTGIVECSGQSWMSVLVNQQNQGRDSHSEGV